MALFDVPDVSVGTANFADQIPAATIRAMCRARESAELPSDETTVTAESDEALVPPSSQPSRIPDEFSKYPVQPVCMQVSVDRTKLLTSLDRLTFVDVPDMSRISIICSDLVTSDHPEESDEDAEAEEATIPEEMPPTLP